MDFGEQVVDLPLGGADVDFRVEQTGGADELFHRLPRFAEFVGRGRRRHADELGYARVEFLKGQGAVVVRRPHPESVIDEIFLAGEVAVVHGADLRDGHVALVDKDEKFPRGEIVEQSERRLARLPAVEIAAVIFDAAAIADLPHHFQVVFGALFKALRFENFARVLKRLHLPFQILFDHRQGVSQLFRADGVLAGGEDRDVGKLVQAVARQRLHFENAVDLVPEKFHPDRHLRIGGGKDLHRIPAHPEGGALEIHVVAGILQFDELAHEGVPLHLHAGAQGYGKAEILFGRAETVNAGHRRHHDHVLPLHQGTGRRVAELVDLVV